MTKKKNRKKNNERTSTVTHADGHAAWRRHEKTRLGRKDGVREGRRGRRSRKTMPRVVGWKDGGREGRTDGGRHGRTDGRRDGRTEERINGGQGDRQQEA